MDAEDHDQENDGENGILAKYNGGHGILAEINGEENNATKMIIGEQNDKSVREKTNDGLLKKQKGKKKNDKGKDGLGLVDEECVEDVSEALRLTMQEVHLKGKQKISNKFNVDERRRREREKIEERSEIPNKEDQIARS